MPPTPSHLYPLIVRYVKTIEKKNKLITRYTHLQKQTGLRTLMRALFPYIKKGALPYSEFPSVPLSDISEKTVITLIEYCQSEEMAPNTECNYVSAFHEFLLWCRDHEYLEFDEAKFNGLVAQHGRKPEKHIPELKKEIIERVFEYVLHELPIPPDDPEYNWGETCTRLRALRDRAYFLTLVTNGQRVGELCRLKRKDIVHGKTTIIGKGNKQATIYFSDEALEAIHQYLAYRTNVLDGTIEFPLEDQPLFARHDDGAGRRSVKALSEKSIRVINIQRGIEAYGKEAEGYINPHRLRHYFATMFYHETHDLELTRLAMRHSSAVMTERYVHTEDEEVEKAYREIFNKKP